VINKAKPYQKYDLNTPTTYKKILSNISWLLSDKFLDVILRVTIGVLIARHLGAEWFGHLNYALTVVAIAGPLAKLGLSNIVVKHISTEPRNSDTILGTAFILQLVCSIGLYIGFFVFIYLFSSNQHVTDPLVAALAITLVFHSTDTIVAWNQSQLTSKYTVIASRSSVVLGFLIKFALIKFSVPFSYFVWAWIIESALKSLLLFYLYSKKQSFLRWKFNFGIARELLRNSWPLVFSSIASIIYLKIDVVMLGNMLSGRDVGVYSAAVRISELLYFIPTIVTATLLPSIVRAHATNRSYLYTRMQLLFDGLAIYCYLSIVIFYVLSDWIVMTLYGRDYFEAAFILKLHVFALIFVSSGVARNKLLIAENKTVFIMVATCLGAFINITLNYYMIPKYSGYGAAIATVISYGFSSYLACLFWGPTKKIFEMMSLSILVAFRPYSIFKYSMRGLKNIWQR